MPNIDIARFSFFATFRSTHCGLRATQDMARVHCLLDTWVFFSSLLPFGNSTFIIKFTRLDFGLRVSRGLKYIPTPVVTKQLLSGVSILALGECACTVMSHGQNKEPHHPGSRQSNRCFDFPSPIRLGGARLIIVVRFI